MKSAKDIPVILKLILSLVGDFVELEPGANYQAINSKILNLNYPTGF